MMLMTSYKGVPMVVAYFLIFFSKFHFNTVILVYGLSKSIKKQQSYEVLKF